MDVYHKPDSGGPSFTRLLMDIEHLNLGVCVCVCVCVSVCLSVCLSVLCLSVYALGFIQSIESYCRHTSYPAIQFLLCHLLGIYDAD